jgi:hypothetical protein
MQASLATGVCLTGTIKFGGFQFHHITIYTGQGTACCVHSKAFERTIMSTSYSHVAPHIRAIDAGTKRGVLELREGKNPLLRIILENEVFELQLDSVPASKTLNKETLITYMKSPSDDNLDIELNSDKTLSIFIYDLDSTGLRKTVWETTIKASTGSENTQHDYTLQLVEHYTTLHSLHAELQLVADDWKHTAQELEGLWDTRESELYHNFLTLYNQRQLYIAATEEQVASLEKEKIKLQHELTEALTHRPAPRVAYDLPEPDQLLDDEMVARLAAGPNQATANKRKRRAAPLPPPAAAAAAAAVKVNVNAITGATEYYDEEALYEDMKDDAETVPVKKEKKRAGPTTIKKKGLANRAIGKEEIESDDSEEPWWQTEDYQSKIRKDLEKLKQEDENNTGYSAML